MDFDLHSMNLAARELLTCIEADVELLRHHGHDAAADRAVRKVAQLTDQAAGVSARLDNMPDGPGLALHAALNELERRMAAPGAPHLTHLLSLKALATVEDQ